MQSRVQVALQASAQESLKTVGWPVDDTGKLPLYTGPYQEHCAVPWQGKTSLSPYRCLQTLKETP